MKIHILLIVLLTFCIVSCHKDDNTEDMQVTSVKLNKTSFSLVSGGREKLLLITEPAVANVSGAKWSSSDIKIAAVDEQGVVTALAAGDATITVSVGNSINEQCVVKIIASPVKDLILPEVKYPIAKDAIVFIQGDGFKTGDKIILRKMNTTGLSLKSAPTDDDLIAKIHELAASYIAFYCLVNPGWYSVILEQDNAEYDLGNIEVETPNIPEYVYDKNKIFWEDTHWRRFQLRGKVKEMKTTESYYHYWTSKNNYTFNEKGFIIVAGNGQLYNTYYEYDIYNRVIKKEENCNISSDGTIDQITCEFSYGNHDLYLPIDFGYYIRFQPWWYDQFYFGYGAVHYHDRFNLDTWQKGLIGIKTTLHYKEGKTVTKNMQFNISQDEISTIYPDYFNNEDMKYLWEYDNTFPLRCNQELISKTDNKVTQYNKINYVSVNSQLPPNGEIRNENGSYSLAISYVQNCPFELFETFSGYSNSTFSYNKNWDIIKFEEKDIFPTEFFYTSYDSLGNWTQCVARWKYSDGKPAIQRLSREFTYW